MCHVCRCCVRARCLEVGVGGFVSHQFTSAAAAACARSAASARLNFGTPAVISWKTGNGDRVGRGTSAPATSVQGSADAGVSTGLEDGLV